MKVSLMTCWLTLHTCILFTVVWLSSVPGSRKPNLCMKSLICSLCQQILFVCWAAQKVVAASNCDCTKFNTSLPSTISKAYFPVSHIQSSSTATFSKLSYRKRKKNNCSTRHLKEFQSENAMLMTLAKLWHCTKELSGILFRSVKKWPPPNLNVLNSI